MVAALPSVTNRSRVSLLSGSLQTGEQKAERDGFGGRWPTLERPISFIRLTWRT